MQLSLILATFVSAATAGNVCLSWSAAFSAAGDTVDGVVAFPAGGPCDNVEMQTGSAADPTKFCSTLPQGLNLCGQNANFVKVDDADGVDDFGGCGIRLEINGQVYPGRRLNSDATDCDGRCDLLGGLASAEITGEVVFEGVPMC